MKCGTISIKKQKIWIWRAPGGHTNRTIGWYLGDRSDETFKKIYQKMNHLEATFYSDGWKAYRKVISAGRLVEGKQYTVAIEQNNSNIRHYLARMTRRTKVVSRSVEIGDPFPATMLVLK